MESIDKTTDVIDFMYFIDADTKGAISRIWKEYIDVVRVFLEEQNFAFDIYNEYIKTSRHRFPTFNHLMSIITSANERQGTIDDKVYFFCFDLWMYIYH